MAIFREEFLRCKKCGGVEFRVETVGCVPFNAPGYPKLTKIPWLEQKERYICIQCGEVAFEH